MIGRKLDGIKIEGYRSIHSASVSFGNINILIGANGTGKSNFLSAFALIQKIVSHELQSTIGKCGATSMLYNGPKVTQKISMEALFDDDCYGFTLVPTDDERMMFSTEYHSHRLWDNEGVKTFLGDGHFESNWEDGVKNGSDNDMKPVLSAKSWRVYHFHDTSRSSLMKRPFSIHDNVFLMQDARNIAPFLFRLKEEYPANYKKIVSAVRLVAPFFEDFVLVPNINCEQITLRWKKTGYDGIMGPNQLSDGIIRFICLSALLLQPGELRPSTIIIDEPELGIFPQAMVFLAEMIKSVGSSGQLIISTQSADLVDVFAPDDIIVVNDDGNGTSFSRLESDRLKGWLGENTLGQLWRKNMLTGDYRR